ncbi:MAG: T9SS type A sorting domain-containing protein [Bacteroidetes bacterium]|nr:T9SS type A sorting domain-containing protein [Bacteroidota bacterium]MBT6685776.1 T9SS type A sorting domain-containing protein [Bacteroidota bacterium]MBT7142346.1 T9SS type A sorting domain-containing protein [Bacteroidota bacterium]MBT7492026.1 T9SS type A sorting domain-containing protein [Bacteroidota bacterium]
MKKIVSKIALICLVIAFSVNSFGQAFNVTETSLETPNITLIYQSDILDGTDVADTLFLQDYSNEVWNGEIKFIGINGANSSTGKIVITNENVGEPLTILSNNSPTADYIVHFENCKNFEFIGRGDVSDPYGIIIDCKNGVVGVNGILLKGFSDNYIIDGIEITHSTGSPATTAGDHTGCGIKSDNYWYDENDDTEMSFWGPYRYNSQSYVAGYTIENVEIKNCKIHDIGGTGILLGDPNNQTTTVGDYTIYRHGFTDLKIHDNIIEDLGDDGIKVGDDSLDVFIYKNKIKDFGGQISSKGINIGQSSWDVEVYSNQIEDGVGYGIYSKATGELYLYNNLIVEPSSKAIYLNTWFGGNLNYDNGIFIYHNTIVEPGNDAIYFNHKVSNNNDIFYNIIVCAYDAVDYHSGENFIPETPVFYSLNRNFITSTLADVEFRDPANSDYNLKAFSPCNDSAATDFNGSFEIDEDFDGTTKPSYHGSDVGAYESYYLSWSHGTIGSDKHTLEIPNSSTDVLKVNISNNTQVELVATEDYIGVFYTNDDGKLSCGGCAAWPSSGDLSLEAFKDNSGQEPKYGFTEEEEFIWLVYDASSETEFTAHPIWDSGEEKYANGQTSYLDKLKVSHQEIDFDQTWSIISSYIKPLYPQLEFVTKDIEPWLDRMFTYDNGSDTEVEYEPSSSTNDIGDIVVGEGYKIRMTDITKTLDIYGEKVETDYEFDIIKTYDIIGFLRITAGDVEDMFSDYVPDDIDWIKNEDGYIYWPDYSINQISDMEAGEGYTTAIKSGGSTITDFSYPWTATKSYSLPREKQETIVYTDYYKTYYSMGVVILPEAWDVYPEVGDEIGVFDSNNNLCGSAVYEGGITIFLSHGDDKDSDIKEGLNENEPITIKVYSALTNIERIFEVESWELGDGTFEVNKNCVANKIVETKPENNILFPVSPNPANDLVRLSFYLCEEGFVDISICDIQGSVVSNLISKDLEKGYYSYTNQINNLNSGYYIIKYFFADKIHTQKLSVIKL